MHISIIGSQSSIHIVRWANSLAERGYKVDVLTMHSGSEKFHSGVKVIQLRFSNPYGYVLNIIQVRKVLKDLKPDIVHAFYAFGHGFLARMSGLPYVISVMGSDVYDDVRKNFLYRNITIKNIEQAEQICSTSYVMAEQTKELCRKSFNLTITPFGVDTDFFKPGKKVESGYDFIIGTVKWMEPKYGIDILIKAFSRFCSQYPKRNFKLVLVGGGDQLGELNELARELEIEENCEFVGMLNKASLSVPDGIPLIIISRWLGIPLKEKVSGSSYFINSLRAFSNEGKTVFFLGGRESVLMKITERIKNEEPKANIVGHYSPPMYFEKSQDILKETIDILQEHPVDVLYVAASDGRGEKFLAQNIDKIPAKVAIQVGAAFDFYSGEVTPMPEAMKKIGLGWFFRLLQNPKKMFSRYFFHDIRIFKYALKQKK